ncbi:MAG: YgiT-type zinc finger protein [Caldilineae bacterium]|nr:MAG: YgiT-type zinc finger protein [Caldilineae bacterium]
MAHTHPAWRESKMKCIVHGCPGEMEERRIVHTFVRRGKPIVIEDLPAYVCPMCGYTVLDMAVLDTLFSFDPDTVAPVKHAPVFRLPLTQAA